MLLHPWASGLALTSEARQHYCCHFRLISCERVLAVRSSLPFQAGICVILLSPAIPHQGGFKLKTFNALVILEPQMSIVSGCFSQFSICGAIIKKLIVPVPGAKTLLDH